MSSEQDPLCTSPNEESGPLANNAPLTERRGGSELANGVETVADRGFSPSAKRVRRENRVHVESPNGDASSVELSICCNHREHSRDPMGTSVDPSEVMEYSKECGVHGPQDHGPRRARPERAVQEVMGRHKETSRGTGDELCCQHKANCHGPIFARSECGLTSDLPKPHHRGTRSVVLSTRRLARPELKDKTG